MHSAGAWGINFRLLCPASSGTCCCCRLAHPVFPPLCFVVAKTRSQALPLFECVTTFSVKCSSSVYQVRSDRPAPGTSASKWIHQTSAPQKKTLKMFFFQTQNSAVIIGESKALAAFLRKSHTPAISATVKLQKKEEKSTGWLLQGAASASPRNRLMEVQMG